MAEKPLEELKKICLICGCHTNQTINIHEPRNGPNILELIQAKFKFRNRLSEALKTRTEVEHKTETSRRLRCPKREQPANEDKYLCFSCNNWLINWHSIQNITSQPGSRDGKFRSHINESIPEEETDESSSSSPSGAYKPRNSQYCKSMTKRMGFYFPRGSLRSGRRTKRSRRKYQLCFICNKHLKRRLFSVHTLKGPKIIKCLKCAKVVYQRRYTNYILQRNRMLFETPRSSRKYSGYRTNTSQRNKTNRNSVDPNILSMLERIGTTLSYDSSRIPLTKEPQSNKHFGMASIKKDEILLDFNTTITEVLPLRTLMREDALNLDLVDGMKFDTK